MKNKIVSLIFILFISHFSHWSRRSNILLVFLCVGGFLISNSSIAFAIEVGGHLTEDTTWSPENNPYHVIDDVYVDDEVTLTILPGTIVKLNAAPLTSYQDMDNFVYYNGENIAKMIQVDGRLIANGTEENPITFTRIQDSLYYHWGIIYLNEFADLCSFKYCNFKYSAYLLIVLGIIPSGAISAYNEEFIIEHCNFVDNFAGVYIDFFPKRVIIKQCSFYNIDNISPTYPGYHVMKGIKISPGSTNEANNVLIAGNSFIETDTSWGHVDIRRNTPTYVVNNYFLGENGIHSDMESDFGSYIYNNEFISCDGNGGAIYGGEEDNALFIKKNNFIGGNDGIDINNAYVEISDNYFEDCDLDTGLQCSGKIFNNKINYGNVRTSGYVEVYNNIGFAGENGIIVTYRNEMCNNNLSIQNQYAFDGAFSNFFNNCIFISNEEISNNGVSGNPIFRNCILDFELPPECIDGGGNIWVDSLQSQSIFEDIQNGDFHLTANSIAIDAGFDTLGYYYPFDLDYNHRVWDGDNNGSAIIDIGPYEYGSPAFGGIEGYTYNPATGNPVDYVLLKVNNESGEFTFSDSIGNFEYKLPAGVYDIYAERVFYEDVIEYQIEVIDGEFTQLAIPMFETVDVEENEIIQLANILNLTNYPNPFNPSTTISFSVQNNSNVELSIFNIKGQKVTTLINEEMQKGKHSIIWSGLDSNNKSVSSGIYFYKIKASDQELVKRMLLLK
ncbi:MAG: T9SS type A sorting domain-containing protein [Candidatus Tenebribacter mawsonii]|nr:T9SS type A sorting domain-containing protein [Candidatus Tenebribacter mawsonii]